MSEIRAALKRLNLGVYIVTASHGDSHNGMTAAWVCQASHKPPMVVVSIAPPRYSLELIRKAGGFGLNVLAQGERGVELGKLFGLESGRKTDKLARVDWEPGAELGTPVLEEAIAWMECKLTDEFPAGDHLLVVGEIVAAGARGDEAPLKYRFEDYW